MTPIMQVPAGTRVDWKRGKLAVRLPVKPRYRWWTTNGGHFGLWADVRDLPPPPDGVVRYLPPMHARDPRLV